MPRFSVTARGAARLDPRPAEIDAPNWLTALGIGLERLGVVTGIDRLACEVLPNGVVLARDVRSGTSFVIEPSLAAPGERPRRERSEEIVLDTEDMVDTAEDHHYAGETVEDDPDGLLALSDDMLEEGALEGDADPRLGELLEDVLGAVDAAGAWRAALDGALALIPAESGSALVQEWDNTLRFLYARGPRSMQVVGQRIPPGAGIAGFCVGHQIGLLIRDAQQDPRFFSTIDRASGYRTSSVLAAPVVGASVCFGCLELLNAPDGFAAPGEPEGEQGTAALATLERIAAALAETLLTVA